MQYKTLLLVLIACVFNGFLVAQAQITAVSTQASTVATSAVSGGTAWTNLSNVLASDNSFATCSITGINKSTYNLDVKNWGFQTTDATQANYVPATAAINGIEVTVKVRKTGPGNIRDNKVILLKADTEAGSSKARTKVSWPTASTAVVYGTNSDLWGTTWTVSDLINTNFGVRLVAKNKGSLDVQAEIDYVSIRVYFNQVFYYSKSSGDLSDVTTWGRNTDGTGANPSNFTTNGGVFFLRNRTSATLTTGLTISGAYSKLVLGDSTTALTLTIPSTAALTARVDILPQASLVVTNLQSPTIGTISDNTTVTFNGAGTQTVDGVSYYNLTLSGSGTKNLSGSTNSTSVTNVLTVGSGVTFNNAGYNIQVLGTSNGVSNDGTISGSGTLTYSLLDVTTSIAGNGTYSNLQIDASSSTSSVKTVTISNATSITGTLTLGEGTLSNGTNLTMQPQSVVAVTNGTLGSAITASSGYDVIYNLSNSTSKATSNEVTGTVRNLTLQTQMGTITLSRALVLTGCLLINSGTLDPNTAAYSITVGGNFTNYGTMTYRNSALVFNGSAAQMLTASSSASFYDLMVNGPGGVQLAIPVTVNHTLSLTQGVITTSSTNSLTLGSGATISGGSSSSYIAGPLVQTIASTASTSKVFPVGKGGDFRPLTLTLSQSSNTSTTYTAEVFNTAPTARTYPSDIGSVSIARYWNIASSNASTISTATIKLVYGKDDDVYDAANTRIVKSASTAWSNIGGAATSVSNGSITSAVSFTTLGDFALARTNSASSILPVTWVSFTCKWVNNKVALSWETNQDDVSTRYTIQRSLDGMSWQELGMLAGMAAGINSLQFVDELPEAESYYRIQQVSANGKISFSKIISVKHTTTAKIVIFSNPAFSEINFSVANAGMLQQGKMSVMLINAMAQTVYTSTETIKPRYKIPGAHLPKGAYTLVIADGSQRAESAIVLQ